jgi:hypothetical protein
MRYEITDARDLAARMAMDCPQMYRRYSECAMMHDMDDPGKLHTSEVRLSKSLEITT